MRQFSQIEQNLFGFSAVFLTALSFLQVLKASKINKIEFSFFGVIRRECLFFIYQLKEVQDNPSSISPLLALVLLVLLVHVYNFLCLVLLLSYENRVSIYGGFKQILFQLLRRQNHCSKQH